MGVAPLQCMRWVGRRVQARMCNGCVSLSKAGGQHSAAGNEARRASRQTSLARPSPGCRVGWFVPGWDSVVAEEEEGKGCA